MLALEPQAVECRSRPGVARIDAQHPLISSFGVIPLGLLARKLRGGHFALKCYVAMPKVSLTVELAMGIEAMGLFHFPQAVGDIAGLDELKAFVICALGGATREHEGQEENEGSTVHSIGLRGAEWLATAVLHAADM